MSILKKMSWLFLVLGLICGVIVIKMIKYLPSYEESYLYCILCLALLAVSLIAIFVLLILFDKELHNENKSLYKRIRDLEERDE